MGGESGNNADIFPYDKANGIYKFVPGTYYFAVHSESHSYSASSTYIVNFKKIATMSNSSSIAYVGLSENAGIVFETNVSGTVNYVNGNPIDYSYIFHDEISNSSGYQLYDISIDTNAGACVLLSPEYQPVAVHYISSTKPAMHVSSRPALLLTYYAADNSNFYKINCRGTGAYSMNTLRKNSDSVQVLIDPVSGRLIDIYYYNYYYNFAPYAAGNSITTTASYTMDLFKLN